LEFDGHGQKIASVTHGHGHLILVELRDTRQHFAGAFTIEAFALADMLEGWEVAGPAATGALDGDLGLLGLGHGCCISSPSLDV
jgi:hypothetical protein